MFFKQNKKNFFFLIQNENFGFIKLNNKAKQQLLTFCSFLFNIYFPFKGITKINQVLLIAWIQFFFHVTDF